jgi:predicted SAM-dependent methyltransferase
LKKAKYPIANNEFPETLECSAYRSIYDDLKLLSDSELEHHYRTYGEIEGRISNRIKTRENFADLVMSQKSNLEIGPFASPLLKSDRTSYADILSTDELKIKAESIGISGSLVPKIDYVIDGSLSEINDKFDNVLASHVIEHVPDLISHLNAIEEILNDDGRYFLLIPDHRFCFDHFQSPSDIGDVVAAHLDQRVLKTFKSLFNGTFNTTHNSSPRHWVGDHGSVADYVSEDLIGLIDYYQNYPEPDFDDLHCWYFTPSSFSKICSQLVAMKLIKFHVERLYPTRKDANEFWAILRKV